MGAIPASTISGMIFFSSSNVISTIASGSEAASSSTSAEYVAAVGSYSVLRHDRAARLGEELLHVVGQGDAVDVVAHQQRDVEVTVLDQEVGHDPTLQHVGRGGAEVQPLVLVGVEDSVDVFAGEICSTPAVVILSITVDETLDDAAPMTASTSSPSSLSTLVGAMFGEPSPESA